MSRLRMRQIAATVMVAGVLVAAARTIVLAGGGGKRNQNAVIFPPNSHPYGQSYGEWAAAFWQYALPFPVGESSVPGHAGV